ncbi:MAG TPA: hypothetical protein VF157_13345, partial [Chloroflexota bacterium]
RPLGILIDSRNMMSLSRVQTAAWTVLILSAFAAAGLGNASRALFGLADALPDPLGIGIPQAIWGLMGISTVSLVRSPLIKNYKRRAAAGGPGLGLRTGPLGGQDAIGPRGSSGQLHPPEIVHRRPADPAATQGHAQYTAPAWGWR